MEGNVVTAAKWLGAAIVLASAILVGGLRWALSPLDRDRSTATPPIAAKPADQAGPRPGDLEELAKSFHGLGTDPNIHPSVENPPRLLFTEPSTETRTGTATAPLPAGDHTAP